LTDPAAPFEALDRLTALIPPAQSWPDGDDLPPFRGGIVGWLAYEAGRHLERLPEPHPDQIDLPEVAFGLYDVIAAFDQQTQKAWVFGWPGRAKKAQALADRLTQALAQARTEPLPPPSAQGFALVADQSRPQAEQAIAGAIAAIYAGELFQANVTQRWRGQMPPGLGPWDLYRRLRRQTAAPFAAMATFGGAHLLSASPERFLSVSAQGAVESRPIKGTRPRGHTQAEDQAQAAALQRSLKDRAENLMIVDLMRNDLSRVCRVGSVKVPVLCGLESFASVHHLVSVVTGQLAQGQSARSLLRAAFPGGSITGAPKIHAITLLKDLEPCRRGLYCGSLFWLGSDGAFDSSILIRSLMVGRSGAVAAHAGGGIVADSIPAEEWAEAVTKVTPLIKAAAGGTP
jgi:para-aminobenzoate synthetase component 1